MGGVTNPIKENKMPKKKDSFKVDENVVVMAPNEAYQLALLDGQTSLYDLPARYVYVLECNSYTLEAVIGCVLYQLDQLYQDGKTVIEPELCAGPVAGLTLFLQEVKKVLDSKGHGSQFGNVFLKLKNRWEKCERTYKMALSGKFTDKELKEEINRLYGVDKAFLELKDEVVN